MTARYKVSIIMPSLNVADYIDECIQSAINQTIDNFEIICVDAGSTDGTWEKLSHYAANNERITLLHSDIRSYGYQVNLGIKRAQGEYIAVLETDDYVDLDMYDYLYNIGIRYGLDLVKADYDNFITFPDGNRAFSRIRLWNNEPEKYNSIIDPRQNSYLYANDYNIWKGIYRRDFLIENNIFLNESKGAAFQDIGFAQQVLACCERAYYSDKSFYRYRMDREMSSINSVHGLEYAHNEFLRLCENDGINSKLVCKEGLYRHMAQSFFCELNKTLIAVEFDINSEYIKQHYDWFRLTLKRAMDNKILDKEMCPQDLVCVLEDYDDYVDEYKQRIMVKRNFDERVLSKCKDRDIVIFGAGARGAYICKFLKMNNITVKAICDNNSNIWNTQIYGIKVMQPKECVNTFGHCTFFISAKYYQDEIKKQLLQYGVEEINIAN